MNARLLNPPPFPAAFPTAPLLGSRDDVVMMSSSRHDHIISGQLSVRL